MKPHAYRCTDEEWAAVVDLAAKMSEGHRYTYRASEIVRTAVAEYVADINRALDMVARP